MTLVNCAVIIKAISFYVRTRIQSPAHAFPVGAAIDLRPPEARLPALVAYATPT